MVAIGVTRLRKPVIAPVRPTGTTTIGDAISGRSIEASRIRLWGDRKNCLFACRIKLPCLTDVSRLPVRLDANVPAPNITGGMVQTDHTTVGVGLDQLRISSFESVFVAVKIISTIDQLSEITLPKLISR